MADDSQKAHPSEEEKDKNPPPDAPEDKGEELEVASPEVLKQFDTFEVQDMPESNELLERRRRIKNQLKELDMDPKNEDEAAAFGESDEGGFFDILKEAGLGPRQLRFCCGGVLVLGVLVLLIYGVSHWWGDTDFSFNWGSDNGQETPVTDDDDDNDDDNNNGLTYPDSTLSTGMDLGNPESQDTGTTEAGEDLGLTGNGDDSLQRHINDFSKVYETAQVDVNELLNQSSDRREALKDYQDQLNFYYHLALQAQQDLQDESEVLSDSFTTVEDNKNEQEGRFFDQLNELDAYASTAALDSFVGYSQELIRLRAHYMARQKLLDYYEQVLPFLETKITDIDLNEEALVKGVHVVEVEGSDLNLIQNESDL